VPPVIARAPLIRLSLHQASTSSIKRLQQSVYVC
jgi:hypothetical protein